MPPKGADSTAQDIALESHLQKLVDRFFSKDARYSLVTIVEGNLDWVTANALCAKIDSFMESNASANPRTTHMVNVDKAKNLTYYGVLTTGHAKECMIKTAAFYMGIGKVSLDKLFFTGHPHKKKGVCDLLERELNQMRRIKNKSNQGWKVTGKGETNMDNDDLGMAFLLGIHWSRRHLIQRYPAIEFSAGQKEALVMDSL